MNDIAVLVVDDDALARRSIISILDEGTRASVAGECVNGAEAVRFLAQHRVDVVLMDLHMPVMGGLEAIKTIHDTHPGVSVVALTSLDVRDDVVDAFLAGARGHLLKSATPRQLAAAIESAASGLSVLSSHAVSVLMPDELVDDRTRAAATALTSRDRRIVAAVAAGASNREIARELGLAETTVKAYVSRILKRMSCRSRGELAACAHHLGLDRQPREVVS